MDSGVSALKLTRHTKLRLSGPSCGELAALERGRKAGNELPITDRVHLPAFLFIAQTARTDQGLEAKFLGAASANRF